MRRVTLLLSGVPQFVTLRDLSYNLDRLFNTNEIDTFKVRDLPNHPQTNKRQIALDFRTGYEAMVAQEKLEGYTYELENGREYTLHAKINKFEEYMCSESPEYGSHWYGDSWMGFAMMPHLSDGDIYKAHSRLDAQLELLEKQKLVLEKEKELLNEKQRLKRKYGSMYSSLYEVSLTPQAGDNHVELCDSETEVSPPKRSRSTSRDRLSNSRHRRSRSREHRPLVPHRSRSKDTGYKLPQIEWYEEHTKTRELRSYSGERSRSRAYSRDRKSSSRELRDRRYPISRHREQRSRSNDRDRYRRATSRERGVRTRSRSKERLAHSRALRSEDHRSRSRERMSYRRSRSKDCIPYRGSRSRDKTHLNYAPAMSRSDWDHRRRLRSPDKRTNQLAIIPKNPPRKSPSEWSIDSLKAAGTLTDNTKHEADITKKEVFIKVEKDSENTAADAKVNKTENKTNEMKDKERKKIEKYNSKLRKAEKTALRVQALSKDIMILVAIVVDEIMDNDKIRISASNKVNLIKTLEALVQDRLEPIARVKKYDDNEVLKKYKMEYPMEGDLKMIKQMLDGIPKVEMKEPETTVTVYAESEKNVTDVVILDVDSTPTEQQRDTNVTPIIVKPVETIVSDNAAQIKHEPTKEEPIIIIEDSAEKPLPRHPQFVVVIKTIVKNLNKIVRTNNLGAEIKLNELKYVLRQILRNMVKGQGFLPREEIIRKFREAYPMEKDEEFVRNTIKDIRDGKYPGLSGHVGDTIDNECTDDVILIEKKYDVVTVTDSDDDEMEKKSKTVVINLDCELSLDNHGLANPGQTKPNPSPSDPMPDSSNDHVKSAVNSDQRNPGSANSGLSKYSTNTIQTKKDLANSRQAITSLANSIQAKTVSDNLEEANIAAIISQANIDHAETESTNTTQEKVARGRDMPELSSPGQIKASPVNPGQVMTGFSNLRQANTDLAKICQTKICSSNPGQKTGVANPIQAMKVSNNPGHTNKSPNNPDQVNKGPNNPGCTNKGPNNPGQTNKGPNNSGHNNKCSNNPSQSNKGSNNPAQTNKVPNSPCQSNKNPNNPGQTYKGPNDPDQTNKNPNIPGQTYKGPNNPCQTTKGPNNPAQTNKGLNNPSQPRKGPNHPGQVKGLNNPGQTNCPNNPGQAKGPNNPGQAKGPNNPGEIKKGPNNPNQFKNDSLNPGQVKKGPNNPGQAKGPNNPGQIKKGPNNPNQVKNGSINPGQVKKGPNNPGQARTVPVYTDPVYAGFAYHSQAMIGPFCGQPGITSDKENQKTASLENTIQNLESKGIEETPDNDKTSQHKEDSKENEENDNNLKVTAITIVTSLNELIAKTNANEPKDVSIDEIKKEIEIEGEAELDDSSLNITDGGPRVTSITIMTSDAELFSLGQDRKEVNEIKNETDVYYDAEDNLANDIERAFDDVNFGNSQSEHIEQNSVNSEQSDSVNNFKQLSSTKPVLPQDNRTVQDDEETIESIVKYVASMY